MIRTACIAAILTTGALAPIQSASATVNLNARIELLTNILRNDASFSQRDFSFALKRGGGREMMFKGISGVRSFNNYALLNSWLTDHVDSKSVFEGGSYKFTHSVLNSYFTSPAPAATVTEPTPSVFEGGSYKFTHSVLDSYFEEPTEQKVVAQSASAEPLMRAMMAPPPPIPEPATWAMMIGGFALAGVALRARRMRTRLA
jgi:PEP-CTERM motif.